MLWSEPPDTMPFPSRRTSTLQMLPLCACSVCSTSPVFRSISTSFPSFVPITACLSPGSTLQHSPFSTSMLRTHSSDRTLHILLSFCPTDSTMSSVDVRHSARMSDRWPASAIDSVFSYEPVFSTTPPDSSFFPLLRPNLYTCRLLLLSPKSTSISSLADSTRPKSNDATLWEVATVDTSSSASVHCTTLTASPPFSLRRCTRRFIFFKLSPSGRIAYSRNALLAL